VKFVQLPLPGGWILELERSSDARGFFARCFSADEFESHGLKTSVVQCNISYNSVRGTLRGMHWQAMPHEEAKLVRCTQGAIYDVILDVRRDSPTFGKWHAVELSAANRRMVYVPEGCAHGFQTLVDASEVFYQMSAPYRPEFARGVRWNDPAFGVSWPVPGPVISMKDRSYRLWDI
jgi:dTDP-4-dehydrorhamnose 3,5-epimerase